MKHILTALALATAIVMPGMAQNNPNRMIVSKSGQSTAYNIDRIDQLSFATIEGEVSCDINVKKVSESGSITVSITPSSECKSFLLTVLPGVIARQLQKNPGGAEAYLKSVDARSYEGTFDNAKIDGAEMKAGVEYAVITLAYDKFNCEGEVNAGYFQMPEAEIIGNPEVTYKVKSTSKTSITVDFEANDEVGGYAAVLGQKGELMEQYEQFAGWMGFACVGDMVKGWGVNYPGNSSKSNTWDKLDPNTEYEIFLQAWDEDETYLPLQIINVKTDSQGGTGEAFVTVTQGKYIMNDWGDEKLPSQFLTFTPNDQTWRYHFSNVYYEKDYEENKEEIRKELLNVPEMSVAYWWWFEPLTTDYPIDPSSTCVVISAAQNVNGEWGEIKEFRFTTPSAVEGMPAKSINNMTDKAGTIPHRLLKSKSEAGRIPAKSNIVLVK